VPNPEGSCAAAGRRPRPILTRERGSGDSAVGVDDAGSRHCGALVIYEPNGYVATIFTRSDRQQPLSPQATDQEAVNLYRSMIAFAGRYELSGKRLIYRPEISRNETWNGTEQERVIEVSEDRLETNSVPAVSTLTGARTVFSLVWERAR
jgi:Lipocalin-like domain